MPLPEIDKMKPFSGSGVEYRESTVNVTLGQLVEGGAFSWDLPELNWSAYAYNEEQYARVCDAFEMRYWYREICMQPYNRWIRKLSYRIRYELCPKYNRIYDALDGVNVLADYDEYGKRRKIDSEYPETQLSGNADYLSYGTDEEYENIRTGDVISKTEDYTRFKDVDQMFLDDLDIMFSKLITPTVNAGF